VNQRRFSWFGIGFFLGAMMIATGCLGVRLEEVKRSREISGLAKWSATEAICVHDAKADLERDDPRIGVIDSSVTGGRYSEIKVDWPKGEIANDLEAICRIPGRTNEFLAAESGDRADGAVKRAGRVFRLECRRSGNGIKIRVAQTWYWPEGTRDLEGLACAIVEGEPVIFAAKRAGTIYTARLRFGIIDGERLEFMGTNRVGSDILPSFERKVGDLHIDDAGSVWAVATVDSADTNAEWNDGPFRSAVYRLGKVTNDLSAPLILDSTGASAFVIDGLKVEGLTGSILERGLFTIGSDDEDLGGVWRIIGPMRRFND
jgi:hypothetical protein